MPVLPDFQPGNAAHGRSADALFQGIDQGQSMMARAQTMRLREQENERRQFEFEAKKPVIVANAMADIASAKASVDNATRQEMLRAQAAQNSTGYNDEFLAAMRYDSRNDIEASDGTPEGDAIQEEMGKYATQETLNVRSQKLAELQSKIGWMSLLPEYRGFVDTVNKEAQKAHLDAAGNLKLSELMETAKLRAATVDAAAAARVEAERIRAASGEARASIYTGSRERIKALDTDTKLTLQDKSAKIAAEKQGATIENLLSHAAQADQAAADASAAGDEQSAAEHRKAAASYRDAVQKNTTFAGQAPGAVPDKSPQPRPQAKTAEPGGSPEISVSIPGSEIEGADKGATDEAPAKAKVAPTKVSADAKTVEVGGKTYVIWKDAKGKRAYKIDGNWVPIDTE